MDLHNCKISISERTIRAFFLLQKSFYNSNSNREGGRRSLSRTGWVDKQEKPAELVSKHLLGGAVALI